jgi:hypothetical protein
VFTTTPSPQLVDQPPLHEQEADTNGKHSEGSAGDVARGL